MEVIVLIVVAILLWPLLHYRRTKNGPFVCRNCGSCEVPRVKSPYNFWIELMLWFTYVIPGVLYNLWCKKETRVVCAKCGSSDIVPLDSPVGRDLAARGAPVAGASSLQDTTPISQDMRKR